MTLPLVLAGPIVRRVDSRFCSFWVALSKPAVVTAHVWPAFQQSKAIGAVESGDPLVARGSAPTVRFGAAFFVAVVTARAPASLQPGSIFSYDLSFAPVDGAFTATHLKAQGLLADEPESPRLEGVDPAAPRHLALGYLPGRLPSFVTPAAAIVDLRLAHASCRNAFADGADAMSFLDAEHEAHLADPATRTQQLFLTGDQIYADDVARVMMKPIAELAEELIGGAGEVLPVGGNPVKLSLRNFPAQRRLKLVRVDARLSTTDGHNHMLGFGEFAALHLMAWSTRVWRKLATGNEIYVDPNTGNTKSEIADHLTAWEECYPSGVGDGVLTVAGWLKHETELQKGQVKTTIEVDHGRTTVYRGTVAKVARLLANCATYMIFDDHEITDDWNLNKRWRNQVISNPLGRAILRNGLMAYTVCQAWGNDPRGFTRADPSIFDPLDGIPEPAAGSAIWAVKKPGSPGEPEKLTNNGNLMKLTHDALDGPGPYPAGSLKDIDILLGLNHPDTATETEKKASFHYIVDGPKHRVVVLDTRTHRSYRGEFLAQPNLLGPTLNEQLPEGPLGGDRELLVVVSAVPTLLSTLVEDIIQPGFAAKQDLDTTLHGKQEHDPCHPGVPLTGIERRDVEGWNGDAPALEAFFARLSTYRSAIILSGDVHHASSAVLDYWAAAGVDPISRIVQFTSSAARNEGPSILRPIVRALPFGLGAFLGQPVERLGWKGEAPISLAPGATIPPSRRARMLRSPALLPAGGWPDGTTVTTPPDWRWRARLLRDERRRAELPVTYPFQAPVEEFDPADVPASYARILARHATAALDRKDQMRIVVFMPNAATVSFRRVGTDMLVRQTLFSEASPGSALGAPNTVHEVPLAPPAGDPGPQLQAGA